MALGDNRKRGMERREALTVRQKTELKTLATITTHGTRRHQEERNGEARGGDYVTEEVMKS